MTPISFAGRSLTCGAVVLLSALRLAFAAEPDGAALYRERCAICHEISGETRAPSTAALHLMSPENIVRSLESGAMKQQGALLTPAERRILAEYLTGKTLGRENPPPKIGLCGDHPAAFSPSSTDWNGWGSDLSNARFQPADRAGLTADQVPRLKLKWAFAFPNAPLAWGQPTVVGGRIFVPSANRNVYSLDAKSGCQYWSFETEAPARTAIIIATLPGETKRTAAFLGDLSGNAYAVDAASGELLWKVHVDAHPHARIVGGLEYHDGRVFVPVTGGEEVGLGAQYECCTSRGALVALDAATGKQIWKTYTISEEPRRLGKTAAGVETWGPSGASIWSAPTLDVKRRIIYAGTGDNFSNPATKTSDAVLAFDMDTGKLLWSKQLTENDVFNIVCVGQGCGEHLGPDVDIGASPILVTLANGKRALLVSQKSGIARALDPDENGQILWETRVGRGGRLGGIQWGSAFDGENMYVAVSDITLIQMGSDRRNRRADPKVGGGLFALNPATGEKVWAAAPPICGDRPSCSPAQSAAVSAIPDVVFSGSVDGHLRAYSARDGKVIWDFDTAREFTVVNGITAKGGSMDGPGPTIAGGMLYVSSGYPVWGGLPGNILLAFAVEGRSQNSRIVSPQFKKPERQPRLPGPRQSHQ